MVAKGVPRDRKAPLENFMAKVEVQPNGCWIWTGARQSRKHAYGVFMTGYRADNNRKTVSAHVWAYEYFIGPVPEGLELDHLCRIKLCVCPAHLEPVTHAENIGRKYNF